MGRLHKSYVDARGEKHYVCKACSTDLVLATDLISDEFRSGPHKAMLFSNVVNLDEGELHERQMTSGMHTIRTIFCIDCRTELGWKYVAAADPSNKYKVDKFILIDPLISKRERPLEPEAEGRTPSHSSSRRASHSLSSGSEAGSSRSHVHSYEEEEEDEDGAEGGSSGEREHTPSSEDAIVAAQVRRLRRVINEARRATAAAATRARPTTSTAASTPATAAVSSSSSSSTVPSSTTPSRFTVLFFDAPPPP
jgi:hypothetical protein